MPWVLCDSSPVGSPWRGTEGDFVVGNVKEAVLRVKNGQKRQAKRAGKKAGKKSRQKEQAKRQAKRAGKKGRQKGRQKEQAKRQAKRQVKTAGIKQQTKKRDLGWSLKKYPDKDKRGSV